MTEIFRFSHETHGTEETAARMSDLYGQVSITSDRIDMREQHVGDNRFTLTQLDLLGGYHGTMVLAEGLIVLQPVTGNGTWQIGRDSGALKHLPMLLQPGPPIFAGLDDVRERMLTLDHTTLEATARTLYADDRLKLQFDPDPRPVDARAGAAFTHVFTLAAAVQDNLESELVRASFYQMLAVTTLETFRLAGDRPRRQETATALLHAYQRAIAFIDSSASLPISVVDVAQAARVSLAGLRAAFRAHSFLGLTPEQYLRRTRLAAAHTDLRAADPTRGDTVRAIATRWGFADSGRFARHYRAAYGVNPRWTLDR